MAGDRETLITYGFRGAIVVIGILWSIVGWSMSGSWNDLKMEVNKNKESQWASIAKLAESSGNLDKQISILSKTLDDAMRSNADAVARLTTTAQDHENRIRTLERPHG